MEDPPPFGGDPHARNINIPSINGISLGDIHKKARLVRPAIDDLQLRKLDPLFIPGRCGDTRDHHELNQLLAFARQFLALRLLQPVLGRRDMFIGERLQKLLHGTQASDPEARLTAGDRKGRRDARTTCSLSCQNSFSWAWSRNGKLRTWWTKI
jgi:hypothetical protein